MLDINLLRNDLDQVHKQLLRRGFALDIQKFSSLEEKRKLLQINTETLQAERNILSKTIGHIKMCGENITKKIETMHVLNKKLNIAKTELKILHNEINNFLLMLPNLPRDEVPYGKDNAQNQEISSWGQPHDFDFIVKDHFTLGEEIKGFSFEAAAKISGSRFAFMQGNIARLHRALAQFMMDLHTRQHGYIETYVPYLVNYETLYGTGQLPKFSEDLFHTTLIARKGLKNRYALIPTAEVPLTNLVRNEILEEGVLPIKLVAHTPCFRSEAGSYGTDNKGLIRMHQFDKVELVQIVSPTSSVDCLEELVNHAETVLQLLNLPYRKMLLCTGDMGFSAAKTYDLEVWLPSKKTYYEISSCSNMWDFQARRMKTRYRSLKSKTLKLVHTLNGSALAVGRTLAAILENYQQKNGSILVPKILKPYMDGLSLIT